MGASYSIVLSGNNKLGTAIAVGDLVIPDIGQPDSYVVATTAARAGRRPEGVATTAVGTTRGSFQLQQTGTIPAAVSGVPGLETWVRCSAAGRLEACAAGDPQLIGRAESDGRVHLLMALPTFAELPVATGPGVLLFDGTTITHLPTAGKAQGDVLTLGIGLDISWAPGGAAAFTPASLALSGYWRADGTEYNGSPWAGTASAGTSGGRDISEATNPPALGAAQNGFVPAAFDGVNDRLAAALSLPNFVTATAGSIACLFYATVAAVDAGPTAYYLNPPLLSDATDGFTALEFSSSGLGLGSYNGGGFAAVRTAAATNTWNFGQARWDSTVIEVRVNSGAWVTLARATVLTAAGLLRSGVNQGAGAVAFTGRVLELATAPTRLTDTNFNDFKTYLNSRYALAM